MSCPLILKRQLPRYSQLGQTTKALSRSPQSVGFWELEVGIASSMATSLLQISHREGGSVLVWPTAVHTGPKRATRLSG